MLLIADKPYPATAPFNTHCGDPMPTPQPPYVFVPDSTGAGTVLDVQPNGDYQWLPIAQAGPGQYMQIKSGSPLSILECERNGALIIPAIEGLA